MALADYKLCDVCGNKAFYDANIDDTRYTATWDDREKTPPIGIAVLCPGCNQTHEAVIRPRPVPQPPQEPTPEAVERAANRRSPVINASVPDEVAGRIARELGSDGPPFYVPLEVQGLLGAERTKVLFSGSGRIAIATEGWNRRVVLWTVRPWFSEEAPMLTGIIPTGETGLMLSEEMTEKGVQPAREAILGRLDKMMKKYRAQLRRPTT